MKIDFKIDLKDDLSIDDEVNRTINETEVDLTCICGHKFKERLGVIRTLKKLPCPACGKKIEVNFSQNITVEKKKSWFAKLFGK